jgi:hypothetical protein
MVLHVILSHFCREYIVDLMSDPGTLIASDGADLGREFEESSFADNHQGDKDDGNTQLGSSISEPSSSVCGSFENESKGSTPTNVVDPYQLAHMQVKVCLLSRNLEMQTIPWL